MRVLKFGGTSVANAENIRKTIEIVLHNNYNKQVVVLSAMSGVTDQLLSIGQVAAEGDASYAEKVHSLCEQHLQAAKSLLPVTNQSHSLSDIMRTFNDLEELAESVYRLQELSLATKDRILSFGELLSSRIASYYLTSLNADHELLDSRSLLVTDHQYGNAKVNFEKTNENIQLKVKGCNKKLFIAPGFIARGENGHTTTLGRGGSDYTAAIYAAALDVEALEIWTDVSGMMTADPRWVSNAKPIPKISYKEAMELSHFGAKVIYPPTILPVMEKNIPVWIKNTFSPDDEGTYMSRTSDHANNIVTGISSISDIALLSLEGGGMVGIPGFSGRLFESLSLAGVNVIFITQSSSEYSICVAVNAVQAATARAAINTAFAFEISSKRVEPVVEEDNLAIVALVGDKMKSHPGMSGKMFGALGRNGVNVRAIAQGSSEKNISAVISMANVKKAVNILHEEFFESVYKQVNVFIVGAGNVGSRLIMQLKDQYKYLKKNLKIKIRVMGLANSRRFILQDGKGVDLEHWQELLHNAPEGTLEGFIHGVISKNLRNSIFVDVTANASVAKTYHQLLSKSISVVACNKIACASSYEYYKKLKDLSQEYNAHFNFETNVGAGLPVIGTMNDLLRSGDKIVKIQAVLSGTLNFVFNEYNATKTFAEVVRQAQDEGYTEPDPRLDLGGTDVVRKIMILVRECGYQLEMEDVDNQTFLPPSCFEGSVEDFYTELSKHESHFQKMYQDANAKNCKLKFVAEFSDGKAKVMLKEVPTDSDFYHLYGKDNIVLFYTQRYADQPLVIKGAGAGAEVTASGVFADIIKASD